MLVIALGGFVANLADRFGRRIGKKKLMIGRLRPKHTAQLLTTLSGMAIALIVVVAYWGFSKEFRDWVSEGHKIRQQRDNLVKEVGDLEKQRDLAAKDKKTLEGDKLKLVKDKSLLDRKIADLGKQVESNSKDLKESSTKLKELQSRQAALISKRNLLEQQKNKIQGELQKGTINLTIARRNLNTIQQDLDSTKREYNRSVGEINTIQKKNNELFLENAQLELARQQLLKDKAQAEVDAKSRLADLNAKIDATKKELDDDKKLLGRFEGATDYFRKAPLTFSRGEELARRDISPLLTQSQAEAIYESTLVEASRTAEAKGSRSKDDLPVVTLAPFTNPATHEEVSAAEQQRDVISRLTGSETGQVLIIRAGLNAFQGFPVIALIEISPNPLVFRAGQVLADVRINGRLSEEEIFNQITTFVRDELSDRVRRAGMIPRSNQDSSVGEVSALDLLRLVEDIKGRNATVSVYALADDATRAAGPLKIRFRVR